jgi:Yip1 domain
MNQYRASRQQHLSSEYGKTATWSLPLGEALLELPLQYIKVLIRPSVKTLSREMSKASQGIVLIQLFALVILTIALALLGHVIPSSAMHAIAAHSIGSIRPFALLPSPWNGITFVFASFFIGLCTAYMFSKLFGGQGTFLAHCYCLLLCTVPLVTVSGALLLIPASGPLVIVVESIVAALFLYRLVLHTLTIMAVHDLGVGQAITIVLILPMIVVAVALLVMLVWVSEGEALAGLFELFPWHGTRSRKPRRGKSS